MIFSTIYGLVTLVLIIAFVGLCIWAYAPGQQMRFAQDANIPFIDDMRKAASQGDVHNE